MFLIHVLIYPKCFRNLSVAVINPITYLDVISTMGSVNRRQYGQMPRDRPQLDDDGAQQKVDRAHTVQKADRADDDGAQQRVDRVETIQRAERER